jgi:glycosyltransferase involved in cell wall biosynthesis
MKNLTIAIPYSNKKHFDSISQSLEKHPLVNQLLVLTAKAGQAGGFYSGDLVNDLIDQWRSEYLLLILPGSRIEPGAHALERFVQVANDTGAGLIYSDFRERDGDEVADHPLIDYQIGSIRDNFDFGSVLLLSRREVEKAINNYGPISPELIWGGVYDLRLKLSVDSAILRIPEPLYTRTAVDFRASGEKVFDYVDPRKRDYQIEMERIATEHLKRIGAFLEPHFARVGDLSDTFPVKASIIIPVRNRVNTIADAVRIALAQSTTFDFNVIVVDNHSTDGTTDVLRELATDNGLSSSGRLVHVIPSRTDLGIGGCWNEAVYSPHCGRYAVQLDSDDIYGGDRTLARIVEEFEKGKYAMIIGSYTIVDFDLNELPPGLIDHREWTRENGRNNALRINGLGAPRAFDVSVLRRIGLPNTSYGEDYAVALRISREYEIGRIYDSLYFARRWAGNSDSALPLATMNRYDAYKDRLRTIEILARQKFNKVKGEAQ